MNHFVNQKRGNVDLQSRQKAQSMKLPMSGNARLNSPGPSLNGTGKPRSTRLMSTRAESEYNSSTDGSAIVPATYAEHDMYQAEPHSAQQQHLAHQRRSHSAGKGHVQHNRLQPQFSPDADAVLRNMMVNVHGANLGPMQAGKPWPPVSSNGISATQNDDSSSVAGPDDVEEEEERDEEEKAFDHAFNLAVEDEDTMKLDEVQVRDVSDHMKHREHYLAESNEDYRRQAAQQLEAENQRQLAFAREQEAERQLQSRKRKSVAPESRFADNTPPPTQDRQPGHGSHIPKSMPPRATSVGLTKQAPVYAEDHDARLAQLHNQNALVMPVAPIQLDLDFDRKKLKNMDFKSLLNESFDQPTPAPAESSTSDGNMALSQRLTAAIALAPDQQEQFLALLSLQQWQESGQWFQEQFAAINERMIKSRDKRREIAKAFEAEVAQRHDAVVKETETYGAALKGMMQSGEVVLQQGTPHRKRK